MDNGPGHATNPPVAPGALEHERLRQAGFSDAELSSWSTDQDNGLKAAGFTDKERDAYWGRYSVPQKNGITDLIRGNLGRNGWNPTAAKNPWDAFGAGFGMSVSGLLVHGRKPDQILPEDAGFVNRMAYSGGQLIGDLPFAVTGFAWGAAAGAAAGGGSGVAAAAPTGEVAAPVTVPIGAAIGGTIGAGVGSAALPEGLRQGILTYYGTKDGTLRNWSDIMNATIHGVAETAKQGTIGAITAPIGGAIGGKALKAGASPFVATGADAATQALTGTVVGGALNGHVPDKEDFATAAALALTFHTAGATVSVFRPASTSRVQKNMEEVYRETGMPPWEVADLAKRDPAVRDAILSQDVNGEPNYHYVRPYGPREPEPYTPAERPKPPVIEGVVLPPQPARSKKAATVSDAISLLVKLEGSADDAVSPAGAIGKHQIMPGTARQYMGSNFDVKTLFDPTVNEMVANKIVSHLHAKYHGDMTAIAIAYNAGPGRASQYLTKGEGTRLKAIPDRKARSGIRYEKEAADRDEAWLPLETQKYLANGRRRSGGDMGGGGGGEGGGGKPPRFPSHDPNLPAVLAEGGEGGGGGGKPPGGDRDLGFPADEPGRKSWWDRQNDENLAEEMLRNIGEDPKEPSLLDVDKFLGQFVSELTPARRIDDRLAAEFGYDRTREMGTEDMFRQTYGSDSRASVAIRYGVIDAITLDIKPNSPSMAQAAREATESGTIPEWIGYMLAHRTVDKLAQGVETGLNPKAAQAFVNSKAATRKYAKATATLQGAFDGVLDYAKDSSLFSQKQIDRMRELNPVWISMRRVAGDEQAFTKGKGRGFKAENPLHRMEGSDRQIVDPLVASIDNMRLLMKMADRNRAIGHIVGMVESGKVDLGFKKLPNDPKESVAAAGSDVFMPYGIDGVAAAEAMAPLIAERAHGKLGPNEFLFMRDGVAERWHAESPELARLLRGADSVGEANIVMKTFETFAKVQRAGIVGVPDFPVRNVLVDQITAYIADPLHPPPFVTWMHGIFHVVGKTNEFKDFMAKGGMASTLTEMDADFLARDVHALFDKTNTWDAVVNTVKHPLELAQVIAERLDAASRLGYKLHAEGKGVEPIKAATMSRKAYLDFAERGTLNIANQWAKITPFFRPALLGMKQLGEGLHQDPVGFMSRATLAVAIPTISLYIMNYFADQNLPEGERYQDLPRWQKDSFFVTPPIGGQRFRLRMPREIGTVFGGLVNRILDRMLHDDPKAFDHTAKMFADQFVPSAIPTLVQAPLEIVTNHSLFSGRQLIPNSLEDNTGYMQYTPATSETGKALARALGPPGMNLVNLSPIEFDHLVRSWTGTAGATVLRALDLPYDAERKPGELADIPFVGSFFVRHPGTSSASISDFYEEMHKLEVQKNDFALAMRRAMGGDASEVEETAEAGQYASIFAPIKQALQIQTQAIQGVYKDKEMTDDEKRQAVDQMMPQLIATAENGVRAISEFKKGQLSPGQAEEAPVEEVAPEAPAQPAAAPPEEDLGGAGEVPVA